MPTWIIDRPQRLTLDGAAGAAGETAGERPTARPGPAPSVSVNTVDVWLAHGKLRIVGTDGPARLDVRAVGRKGLTVTLEDGLLSIRHPVKQGWWTWAGPIWWFVGGRRNYLADVTVAIPTTAAASLTMIAGSVVASGLRRRAAVDVTSGSITLMGLGGVIRAKTVSGSIEAMRVAGDLGLETVSGEIALAESSAERVFARTISGAVTCDLDNPFAYDVRLQTTSGSITVRVPADADLDVNLSATSGRITSAFPQVRSGGGPGARAASGRIGTGSGSLSAYAVSGSVSLLASPAMDRAEGEQSP